MNTNEVHKASRTGNDRRRKLGSQVICQIGDQTKWWAAACRRTIDAANRIIEDGNDLLRWIDHANAARTVHRFMWPAGKAENVVTPNAPLQPHAENEEEAA